MREPRLYLYRKAGRTVWDAEMWLPDGRRTWRTGIADRESAERAARARLEALTKSSGLSVSEESAPTAGHAPSTPTPLADSAGEGGAHPASELKGSESGLQRLDDWFFAHLKKLFWQ